ncbi:MAG: phosphate propanoyltransferase [Lachnospiraceae bacterium]
MMINRIEEITNAVMAAMKSSGIVQVEVSARHVHLSQEDLERLFGSGAALTPKRELSQPGQFLSEERVTVVGAKGEKRRTAILGPVRKDSQVELSNTDCAEIGIKAPMRMSGNIVDSGKVTLVGPEGKIVLQQGAIVAQNHIHLTPETAQRLNLSNNQSVRVEVLTSRPVIFQNVIIRVSESFRDRMHIDFDEANAAAVEGFALGQILFD